MNKRSAFLKLARISVPSVIIVISSLLVSCAQDIPNTSDAGSATSLCENSTECDDFSECVAGVCVSGDRNSSDDCQSDLDCPGSSICSAGECVAAPSGCTSSEDCPANLLCNGFTNTCFDPNDTGCDSNESCADEPQCAGVTCICNANGSCTVSDAPPPPPQGSPINLEGYVLRNLENPQLQNIVFESGVVLNPGEILVVGRDATRGEFERYWATLFDSNVSYIRSPSDNGGFPVVNGGEEWELITDTESRVDRAQVGNEGRSYQRVFNDGQLEWRESSEDDANPGEVDLPTTGIGLIISEWSDASGSGNFPFEFIELYYAP